MRVRSTILIAFVLLTMPAALFAQSDGGVETPPPAETPPPQETPPAEAPVETPPPPPETAPEPTPAETAPEPATVPSTAPTPAPTPQPAFMPQIVTPAEAATATPSLPSEPTSVEAVQAVIETVAEKVPFGLPPWLIALLGALAGIIATYGIQAMLRTGKKPCHCCGGTGRERVSGACVGCEGKGTVEEEIDAPLICPHCKGEGEEPCEVCKGQGEIDGKPCAACLGTGVQKDEDGEDLECTTCFGEGETEVALKRQVPCPDCKGIKK